MWRVAGVLAMLAGPVAAGDWVPLNGDEIRAALTARVLAYPDGATQNFFEDGRTLYEKGGASWGKWRVEGDQYCSVWPPSDRWDCYDVAREARGLDIRFTFGRGSITGRYVDLK